MGEAETGVELSTSSVWRVQGRKGLKALEDAMKAAMSALNAAMRAAISALRAARYAS